MAARFSSPGFPLQRSVIRVSPVSRDRREHGEVGETVPHDVAEHDTVQVTPLFVESFVAVAANCAVVPACTVIWQSDTLIGDGGQEEPPPHP